MAVKTKEDPIRKFRGAAYDIFHYQGDEVLLCGAAGTGKSLACLSKLHFLCEMVPGIRALMVRKTRNSLTQSAMVTFEEKVLQENHPVLDKGGTRRMRSEYTYPNGSVIVVGGMDDPKKIMSTEFDLVFVQEAIELRETEWDSIKSRLRNGVLDYQQIMADTNPDHPQHWLKKRCDQGYTHLMNSYHRDNPRYWDEEANDWTPAGRAYMAILDKLRGPLRDRLRDGKWAEASGAIYTDWRLDRHVVPRRELPPEWKRVWAVDFGYRNPFVCLMAAIDPDGRIIVYREIYRAGALVEEHAKLMLSLLEAEARVWSDRRQVPFESMKRIVSPCAIVCDHDAGDRAVLERHLALNTVSARKDVNRGIQVVSERLIFQDDGRPGLEYMENSLVDRDETLAEVGKPTSLTQEISGYVWKDNVIKDEPVKENDHACFVAGTLVETVCGEVPIEMIEAGDLVLTRAGYRRVLAAVVTGDASRVTGVDLSDGRRLIGTDNHPVWLEGRGFVSLGDLRYGDIVTTKEENQCCCQSFQWCQPNEAQRGCHSTGSSTGDTQDQKTGQPGSTFTRHSSKAASGRHDRFTERSGGITTVKYRKVGTSTTRMKIHSTTTSAISKFCRIPTTSAHMPTTVVSESWQGGSRCRTIGVNKFSTAWPSGTKPPKEGNGTNSTPRRLRQTCNFFQSPATIAASVMKSSRTCSVRRSIVRPTAERVPVASEATTTKNESAKGARTSSSATSIFPPRHVPVSVLGSFAVAGKHQVYNLAVEGPTEYYANGVLVSNCDALRYLAMHEDKGAQLYEAPKFVEQRSEPARTPGGVRESAAPRLRFGEQTDRPRRGGKLFGGGG